MTWIRACSRSLAGALALGAVGCLALPSDVPLGARLACETAADCPDGWICRERIGECRSPQDLDETPPELVDVSLTPTLARRGTEVVLTFEVSEALWEPPEVSVDGRRFAPVSQSDGGESPATSDDRFAFRYVTDGSEDASSPRSVQVSLLDANGVAAEVSAGEVTFDSAVPEVTSAVTLTPDDGWLALTETLEVSFSLSETLLEASPPQVNLVDVRTGEQRLPLELQTQTGASYTFRFEPTGAEEEGRYDLVIDLADEAGNLSSLVSAGVELDFTPPSPVNAQLRYDPDADNPIPAAFLGAAKAGTVIALRVDASEPLDELAGVEVAVYPLLDISPLNEPIVGDRQTLDTLSPMSATALDVEVSGSRVIVEGAVQQSAPTGVYYVELTWTDLAGNTTATDLPQPGPNADPDDDLFLWIRTLKPRFSVEQSLVRVVHAPWGTRGPQHTQELPEGPSDVRERLGTDQVLLKPDPDTPGIETEAVDVYVPAGPYLAVYPNDPLAPQAGIPSDAFTFDRAPTDPLPELIPYPVVQVVLYAQQDGPEIGRIGRLDYFPGVIDPRWLRTELAALPFQEIYASGIDLAGNESDRVQLTQAQWVAHPGKSALSGLEAFTAALPRATAARRAPHDASTEVLFAPDPTDVPWEEGTALEMGLGAAWQQLPQTYSSPLPRYGAAVSYDARRGVVVLFGSEASGSDQADTWEWDGRVWRDMTPDAAQDSPSPRVLPGLVFDRARGRTVLFGGTVLGAFNPRDLWEWDGERWTLIPVSATADRPAGRYGHTMVYDPQRERVLVHGGAGVASESGCLQANGQDFFCDLWSWNGQRWTELTMSGDDPGARVLGGAAIDEATERLVMWRGHPDYANDPTADSNDTWELDLETLAWTSFDLPDSGAILAPLNPAFFHAGHEEVAALELRSTAMGTRWTVVTWAGGTWTNTFVAPADDQPILPRALPLMTYVPGRNRIFVAGGFAPSGPPLGDEHLTWELDEARGWFARDPTPGVVFAPRTLAALSWDQQRDVAVLSGGGAVVPGGFGGQDPNDLAPDLLELVGDAWVQRGPVVGPRYGGASTWVPSLNQTALVGGVTSFAQVPQPDPDPPLTVLALDDEARLWDGTTPTSAALPPALPLRFGHAMATTPAGGVLVAGGMDEDQALLGDVWEFDGAGWSSVAAPGPSPRAHAAMALDEARGEVILFGGLVEDSGAWVPSGETWVYNGSTWTLHEQASPGPRAYHAMTYDADRGRVVLFAGIADTFRGDLWEWTGEAWESAGQGDDALFRFGHGLTYDRKRGRLLLAGGMSQNFIFQSTTYERASPQASDVPAVAFEAPAQEVPFDAEDIDRITVRARCSGVYDAGNSQQGFGAQLLVWDHASRDAHLGSWTPVAASASGPGDPLALLAAQREGAEARRWFSERDRVVALQCRPDGPSSAGPDSAVAARVATTFAEVRIDYDVPVVP